MPRPPRDVAGQRFGRLTAIRAVPAPGRSVWRFVCDCGTETTAILSNVLHGTTQSCGCLKRERLAEGGRATRRHGHATPRTPTYRSWIAMLTRAHTGSDRQSSPKYKGRGITVCERWLVFDNFLADMKERPEGTTLDRIDNDKGYFKENCRWATPREQSGNRRVTARLTVDGATRTMREWAEITGIRYATLKSRNRAGWRPDRIIHEPVRRASDAVAN